MKHLVTLRDGFEAKVLAARLGSEGVLVELRGSVDGPYPLGLVYVYVEESGMETARTVLALADEPGVEDATHDDVPDDEWDDEDDAALSRRVRERRRLLAVVAVGVVAALVLLELVRHAGGPEDSQVPVPSGSWVAVPASAG